MYSLGEISRTKGCIASMVVESGFISQQRGKGNRAWKERKKKEMEDKGRREKRKSQRERKGVSLPSTVVESGFISNKLGRCGGVENK